MEKDSRRAGDGSGSGSKEEAEDFASDVFSSRLLVVHDAGRSRHHDEAELKGRERGRERGSQI